MASLLIFYADRGLSTETPEELQRQKIALEIKLLEHELQQAANDQNADIFAYSATFAGSLIAVLTFIWTVYHGLQTIRQSRVSQLLENLSAPQEPIRLGAARALSQYGDTAIQELLAASSTEHSTVVQSSLEETLSRVGPGAQDEILIANSRSLRQRVYLAGRLSKHGDGQQDTASYLNLPDRTLSTLRRTFSVDYEHGKKIEQLHLNRRKDDKPELETSRQSVISVAQHFIRLTEVTRTVISLWLRNNRKIRWPDDGIDLSEANLYGMQFDQNVRVSLFNYSILRHCKATKPISFHCCSFIQADMFDALLSYVSFSEVDFSEAHLRRSKLLRTSLTDCAVSYAVLSESDMRGSKFFNVNFDHSECRSTNFSDASFSECTFSRTELQRATFVNTSASETKFYGAKMAEADLTNAELRGAKFNGADLRGAGFKNAELRGAVFSGANIAGADFRAARTDGTIFDDAKNKEAAIFS